jgi:nucleotide-binding universal stress UspA family protein
VRRIVVALDASSADQATVSAAVEMAACFEAEVVGLFVEDADLFRMAGRSSMTAVDALLAMHHDLDRDGIERLLRARARRMRRCLSTAAEQMEVTVSFRVTRGRVTTEVLAEAEKADVLVLSRSGWALVPSRRISAAARAVLSASPVSTLLLHAGAQLRLPALVVYDGSPLADRALAAALALADRDGGRLTVLILGDGMDRADRLRSRVEEQLGGHRVQARLRLLTEANVLEIASVVQTGGSRTMILPAKSSLLEDEALHRLLEQVDVPVLLVR